MKRILGASFTLVVILALTVSSIAVAQGTTGTSQSGSTSGGGTLNTGTSQVTFTGGSNVSHASVDPVGTSGLDDLGTDGEPDGSTGGSPPPAGTDFLSEGAFLDFGGVTFSSRSVLVCFPDPGAGAVRRWNGTLNRWVTFPTFTQNGLRCTRTRVPGTYAVIG